MSAPSVPSNTAVPTINKNRLMRFTRPFNPASKKGATPAVPARKWRADGEQDNKQLLLSVSVGAKAVAELTSSLTEPEIERALAHKDPLDSTGNEAAQLRSKRFHTEDPADAAKKREGRFVKPDAAPAIVVDPETADARSKRFGQLLTSSASGAAAGVGAVVTVDVAPEVASKRENRFGPTAVSLGVAKPGNTAELSITEEEKKRLSRFK